MNHSKKFARNSIFRLVATCISFLIQVAWFVFLGKYLRRFSTLIGLGVSIISFFFVTYVYNRQNTGAAFKTPWIVLILMFPFIGIPLYLIFGINYYTAKKKAQFLKIHEKIQLDPIPSRTIVGDIEKKERNISNQFLYLSCTCSFPLYKNTKVSFFNEAEKGFYSQLEDIKKAKKFIFMEYFAIEEDSKTTEILFKLLKQKASEGIDVRILYDDIGSIGYVDYGFRKTVESLGVKCRCFNPVYPIVRLFMNNRDHRKITVIDGNIGYTGGYNMADEYFGYKKPYGNWKDTGLRLEGEAVNSLTRMFLEMWLNPNKDSLEVSDYYQPYSNRGKKGYVCPYSDTPLDDERVGETVYMNMIKNAESYAYITSPYLILDDEMKLELMQAAKRGVDVRIITPGVADKKIIYRITRSSYPELVRAGVSIYEYRPGFLHAKQILVDGRIASVGTINMDFRSFYHHFEDGVLMYGCDCIDDIEKDFNDLFSFSENVSERYRNKKYSKTSAFDSIIRLFSSLM